MGVGRCQGWLSKQFLTIEYLNNYPGHRKRTQAEFLQQCFAEDEVGLNKGRQYFAQKGQTDASKCRWKHMWLKSGLQIPIQIALLIVFFAIGICQWQTSAEWSEDRSREAERQDNRTREIMAAKEEKRLQLERANTERLTDYEREQQRLRQKWHDARADVEARNVERQK